MLIILVTAASSILRKQKTNTLQKNSTYVEFQSCKFYPIH